MARLSLAITSIIYYLPLLGLWRIILEKRIKLNIPLFAFVFKIDLPNSGILLLFLYSLITWFVIAALLVLIERILKVDLLEKLKLRNGLLFAEMPRFSINILDVFACVCLIVLVMKYVFLYLFQLLVSAGLFRWLGKLIPIPGQEIGLKFGQVFSSFLSKPLEMAALSFSLLIFLVSIVSMVERRERFYSDIEKSQELRHQSKEQIIVIPHVRVN